MNILPSKNCIILFGPKEKTFNKSPGFSSSADWCVGRGDETGVGKGDSGGK